MVNNLLKITPKSTLSRRRNSGNFAKLQVATFEQCPMEQASPKKSRFSVNYATSHFVADKMDLVLEEPKFRPNPVKGFFVGGQPGSGKTTVCQQLARMLLKNGMNVVGFITEEMRSGGKRVGFEAIDLMTGERAILAREKVTSSKGSKLPTVGKYVINIQEFETFAMRKLQ